MIKTAGEEATLHKVIRQGLCGEVTSEPRTGLISVLEEEEMRLEA